MAIKVNLEKCTGCTLCVRSCGTGAISIKDKKAVIDPLKCTYCGACKDACRFKAIDIILEHKEAKEDLTQYKGVWVFTEIYNGKIADVSFELLHEGKKLAESRNCELAAVVIGDNLAPVVETLSHYGADKIYVAESPKLADFNDEPYAQALAALIKKYKPEIVLSGATSIGRSFIARVAVTLQTGLTADCTALDIDPETGMLLQTRPAFGGNLMAVITCSHSRPQMATVRPMVFQKAEYDPNCNSEILKFDLSEVDLTSHTEVLDKIQEISDDVNITDYDIVVSGGRGLKNEKGFQLISDLAEAVGGVVGASRGAVDAGLAKTTRQVGQTGKTVTPKLYIAVGISGAVQHLAGMENSEMIVAINSDPNAPIFDVATYGIVGDAFEVVPKIIQKIKEGHM